MYKMHFNKQMEEKKKKNDVDTFGNEKTKAVMSWRQYYLNTNITFPGSPSVFLVV